MTREIETWLLDSSVGNNSVVDHRNKYQSSLHCIIVSVCRSTALTLLSEMSAVLLTHLKRWLYVPFSAFLLLTSSSLSLFKRYG